LDVSADLTRQTATFICKNHANSTTYIIVPYIWIFSSMEEKSGRENLGKQGHRYGKKLPTLVIHKGTLKKGARHTAQGSRLKEKIEPRRARRTRRDKS
jgi:hypothetical protein